MPLETPIPADKCPQMAADRGIGSKSLSSAEIGVGLSAGIGVSNNTSTFGDP